MILRTRTRHDFGGYKKPTVLRRIHRRMGLARVTSLGDYARILRQTPSEVTALADDLLIHVTGFFRDPAAWAALQERAIVPLVTARDASDSVAGEQAATRPVAALRRHMPDREPASTASRADASSLRRRTNPTSGRLPPPSSVPRGRGRSRGRPPGGMPFSADAATVVPPI